MYYAKRFTWPEDLSKYPDIAILVAAVISRWSAIEDVAGSLLMIFARIHVDQLGPMMRRIESAKPRLLVILAAGEIYLRNRPAELAELKPLFRRLLAKAEVRNKYAHSVYALTEAGLGIIHRQYLWPENPKSIELVSLEELRNELDALLELNGELSALRKRLWDEIPPSQQSALRETWTAPAQGNQSIQE